MYMVSYKKKLSDLIKEKGEVIIEDKQVRNARTLELLGEWFQVGEVKYFVPIYKLN